MVNEGETAASLTAFPRGETMYQPKTSSPLTSPGWQSGLIPKCSSLPASV